MLIGKELSQYKYIKKEINEQKKYLKDLEVQKNDYLKLIKRESNSCSEILNMQNIINEITKIEILINCNVNKCLHIQNQIEQYIESIDDSQIRTIMRLRYFDELSWQNIAFKIGKFDESYPRRIHNKFIKSRKENNIT